MNISDGSLVQYEDDIVLYCTICSSGNFFRRQGGTSNPHQPLTSNDVYPQQCMAINSNGCSHFLTFALMTTGAFSQNVGKLFSELKLVTDNFLFIEILLNIQEERKEDRIKGGKKKGGKEDRKTLLHLAVFRMAFRQLYVCVLGIIKTLKEEGWALKQAFSIFVVYCTSTPSLHPAQRVSTPGYISIFYFLDNIIYCSSNIVHK